MLQQPAPGLDGELAIEIASVGKLAAWAGQPLDASQPDPGPLSLAASFASDGARTELKQATLEGKAVKARAKGSFDSSGAIPEVVAVIEIGELDVDAYLPPEAVAENKSAEQAMPGAKKGWSEAPLDLSLLGRLNADLKITTGKVIYKGLVIDRSRVTVRLKNSVLKASIDEFSVAGGQVGGRVDLDGSRPNAKLGYDLSVKSVEAKPVLTALADFERLSGKAFVEAQGASQGRSEKEIVSNLQGGGSVRFLDGAIEGIDIAGTLRQAGTLGFGDSGGVRKTDFAELGGTYKITKGVVDNQDFQMLAPLVRVTGAGLVPIPPRMIDYKVEAKLVATAEGQGGSQGLSGVPIPIHVTGSWDDPSYSVDWAGVFAGLDPTQLGNLAPDLQDAAKGFGIALPTLPGLGGGERESGGLGGILKSVLPGSSDSGTTTTDSAQESGSSAIEAKEESIMDILKGVLDPAEPTDTKGDEPAALKALKGLFGGG